MSLSTTRSLGRWATTPWPPKAAHSPQVQKALELAASASRPHVAAEVKARSPLRSHPLPRVLRACLLRTTLQPCLRWTCYATLCSVTSMDPQCIWTPLSVYCPTKSPPLLSRSRRLGRISRTSVGSLRLSILVLTTMYASRKRMSLPVPLESSRRCAMPRASPT